jgi:ribulose-5-phosphate 4-epimerase/fuculose-1-phosphate aldolase
MSPELDRAVRDLVLANRILAHENVTDAYGHVSIRHPHNPERYLLARSRSPQLVEAVDIMEFTLDGKPLHDDRRSAYQERHIHGGIYETRPEIGSVVHAHAEDMLPFGVSKTPFRPIIGSAGLIGEHAPVWDIAAEFGPDTNLLVENMEQGRDLAKTLGDNRLVLMRGHGMAVAGPNVVDAVRMSIYAPSNARVQMAAMRLGEPYFMTPGEVKYRVNDPYFKVGSHGTARFWEYYATRAGCTDLL